MTREKFTGSRLGAIATTDCDWPDRDPEVAAIMKAMKQGLSWFNARAEAALRQVEIRKEKS